MALVVTHKTHIMALVRIGTWYLVDSDRTGALQLQETGGDLRALSHIRHNAQNTTSATIYFVHGPGTFAHMTSAIQAAPSLRQTSIRDFLSRPTPQAASLPPPPLQERKRGPKRNEDAALAPTKMNAWTQPLIRAALATDALLAAYDGCRVTHDIPAPPSTSNDSPRPLAPQLGTARLTDREKGLYTVTFDNGHSPLDNVPLPTIQRMRATVPPPLHEGEASPGASSKPLSRALPSFSPPPVEAELTRIVTYNLRDLRTGALGLHRILQSDGGPPAAILLQETHLWKGQQRHRRARDVVPTHYQAYWGCAYDLDGRFGAPQPERAKARPSPPKAQALRPPAQGGVCILLREDVAALSSPKVMVVPPTLANFILHIRLETVSGPPCHLVNAYIHPSNTKAATKAWDYIQSAHQTARTAGEGFILGGDTNANIHKRRHSSEATSNATRLFRRALSGAQALVKADSHDWGYTFHPYAQTASPRRLDEFLLGGRSDWSRAALLSAATAPLDFAENTSDHRPLALTLLADLICTHNTAQLEPPRGGKSEPIAALPMSVDELKVFATQAQAALACNQERLARPAAPDVMRAITQKLQAIGRDTCEHYSPRGGGKKSAQHTGAVCRVLRRLKERTLVPIRLVEKYRAAMCEIGARNPSSLAGRRWATHPLTLELAKAIVKEPESATAQPTLTDWLQSLTKHCRDLRREWTLAKEKRAELAYGDQIRKLRRLVYKRPRLAHRLIFERGGQRHALTHVRDPATGKPTCDPTRVRAAVTAHFQRLATARPEASFDEHPKWTEFVPKRDGNVLQPHIAFTRKLFDTALSRLPNGKRPGDGVYNEWLKNIPEDLKAYIFEWLRSLYEDGAQLPAWFVRSSTILLYKKGDPTLVKNYRPIALSGSIYKLYTRCITMMLQDFAEKNGLLNRTQEGFRPAMGTSRLLSYFLNTLEDAHITNKNLYILYVDFTSAFNTIGHRQLKFILEWMGYPEPIRRALERIYEHPTTVVKTEHGDTEEIALGRGTIQGDTLSPLVFLIFLDPLLQWIEKDSEGYRSELHDHVSTHGGYADDLVGLSTSLAGLKQLASKITEYAQWGDLDINVSKSAVTATVMKPDGIGRAAKLEHGMSFIKLGARGEYVPALQPNEPYKYLGIWVSASLTWKTEYNYLLLKLTEQAASLRSARLLDEQKLNIAEHKVLPLLRYHLPHVPFTRTQLARIEGLYCGIAKDAMRLMKSTASHHCTRPRKAYGLGLPDLLSEQLKADAQNALVELHDEGPVGIVARALLAEYRRRLGYGLLSAAKVDTLQLPGTRLPFLHRLATREGLAALLVGALPRGLEAPLEGPGDHQITLFAALRRSKQLAGLDADAPLVFTPQERAALRTLWGVGAYTLSDIAIHNGPQSRYVDAETLLRTRMQRVQAATPAYHLHLERAAAVLAHSFAGRPLKGSAAATAATQPGLNSHETTPAGSEHP